MVKSLWVSNSGWWRLDEKRKEDVDAACMKKNRISWGVGITPKSVEQDKPKHANRAWGGSIKWKRKFYHEI